MLEIAEIENWIKKNCINQNGEIDLRYLNFKGYAIRLDQIKAKNISNSGQEANKIHNSKQKAEFNIYNDNQESRKISNCDQKARDVFNFGQEAKNLINNEEQKSEKIFN